MNSERKFSSKTTENVRMAGFLEKKGKMKVMSQWKKYWFVLEERLLLYYRSEIEYTNLSPCKGSLNMGLVSSVRPGSSSGPCIIHVITRSQVVQLRAKNRATQEEWLQALLNSISLPLVTKKLKSPTRTDSLVGYGCSLDNITLSEQLMHDDYENEWTLPTKLDLRRKQISGTLYGGSLDTAIWSSKFVPSRTPSLNLNKGKILNKILSFSKEKNYASGTTLRGKNSNLSLCIEEEMRYIGQNSEMDKIVESEVRCAAHDENGNNKDYSAVRKIRKINKTLSDTELNKSSEMSSLEEKKSESPFERIKTALSRIPKEKILRSKPNVEKKTKFTKKRRQSFLQKVLRKRECDGRDDESEVSEPFYDTIDHQREQSLTIGSQQEKISTDEERGFSADSINSEPFEDSLYSQVHKPAIGSKAILPASTMSELQQKLKSRESLENKDVANAGSKETSGNDFKSIKNEEALPSLPPRRISRPISPWHDIPTNNTPVNGEKVSFFVHQALVKFKDPVKTTSIQIPDSDNDFSDIEDNLDVDLQDPCKTDSCRDFETAKSSKEKNDALSMLLEQLTKITAAPLAEAESVDENYNSSSESEKFLTKSQFSDPDYDIPRPHKPLTILISQEGEIISSTEFMGRCDNSDASSSFRSMELDSLEAAEKTTVEA